MGVSFRELNWPLLLIWVGLAACGLVAIYSATQGPVAASVRSARKLVGGRGPPGATVPL